MHNYKIDKKTSDLSDVFSMVVSGCVNVAGSFFVSKRTVPIDTKKEPTTLTHPLTQK